MDEFEKWNRAAGGWTEDILRVLLERGLGPDFEDLFKNQEAQDEARIKRENTREVTSDGGFGGINTDGSNPSFCAK